MSVTFSDADIRSTFKQRTAIKQWLEEVAHSEKRSIGHIAYIFCSDQYLLNINQQFLNHDTLTDIITFDYSEGKVLNGEIYISLDRVKENAETYEVIFLHELCRVLVHGLLHLSGYHDKKKGDKELMRAREDFHLGALFE